MGNFGIIFLIGHSQRWESFPEFPFPQSEFPQRAVRVYMCLVSRLLWQRLIGPRDQSHWSGMSNGRDGTSAYDAHKGLVLDEYEFADLNASVETFWEGQNVRDSGAGSCSAFAFFWSWGWQTAAPCKECIIHRAWNTCFLAFYRKSLLIPCSRASSAERALLNLMAVGETVSCSNDFITKYRLYLW